MLGALSMRDLTVLAPLTTLRIGGPARDIVEGKIRGRVVVEM